jgi:hypothetical protein
MSAANKIGLGGSGHWRTETIFKSLKSAINGSQGWIRPDYYLAGFSEVHRAFPALLPAFYPVDACPKSASTVRIRSKVFLAKFRVGRALL